MPAHPPKFRDLPYRWRRIIVVFTALGVVLLAALGIFVASTVGSLLQVML